MTADQDPNSTQLESDIHMERAGGMATERLSAVAPWQRRILSRDAALAALRRGWWIILATIAIAMLLAALLTARQEPLFRASTTLVVVPARETSDTGDIIRSLETLERRTVVATFSKIPATPETRAAAALTIGVPPEQIRRYRIQGSVLPSTNVIRIDVEGGDRDLVADLANAVAVVTNRKAREFYRIYSLRTLAEAVPPASPVHPDVRRNYLAALIAGALLGAAAAVAYGLFDSPSRPPR